MANDTHKLALVIEGLAWIAELICRYAVTEALYMRSASKADQGLERAVVKLYASILGYLSKAKQYFEQGTASQCTPSRVRFNKLMTLIRATRQKCASSRDTTRLRSGDRAHSRSGYPSVDGSG